MKKLIKSYLIGMLLILASGKVSAQWAVYDASNYAQTAKLAAEAVQQSKVLGETYGEIKKANEMYTKLNQKMRSISLLKDVIQDQVNLVARASNTIQNIRKLKGIDMNTVDLFKREIDNTIELNKSNIQLIKEFMTDGINMNDGDRIRLLRDIKKETNDSKNQVMALELRAKAYADLLRVYH